MTPRRIQMHRRPGGWRKDHPDAVIVARPTKWGNPWRMGDPGTFWLPDWLVRDCPIAPPIDAQAAVELYHLLIANPINPADDIWYAYPRNLTDAGMQRITASLTSHRDHIRADLHELRGRDLACWCPLDAPCHGDVLLELANG